MKKCVSKKEQNKIVTISDRKEGIKMANMLRKSGDIILIAGKGHETYQEVNGVRHHFDDREIIQEIFNNENQ